MEKKLMKDVCKPNLFLIGAPKCGTTALSYNLVEHPDVFLPEIKELRYFDRDVFYDFKEDYRTKSLEEYLEYYKNTCNFKYRMDGSVFIMYSKEAILNVLKMSPDSKFIVILRDPVEASISMFKQRLSYIDPKMREVCEDFNECWNLIGLRKKGEGYPKDCRNKFIFRYDLLYNYENYIPFLIDTLKDNLFIGFYDEYKENPKKFFEKLSRFLDIDVTKLENKKHNVGYVLKTNPFLQSIEYIYRGINYVAKNTHKVREKLGLTNIGGKKLFNLRDKIYKNSILNLEIKPSKEIEEYFKETRFFLEKLKKQYDKV